MTKKKPSNFVKAIAAEFGPNLTDFSRALAASHPKGMSHSTVVNWQKNNRIRDVYDHLIIAAAKQAKLGRDATARIKALLEKR